MCDCISSVSKKCHNLVQHSGTICNSLIVKTYQSQFDELSEFDCGKIIMFIKVKDNGVTSIKKFVLLGPEMEESLNVLNAMFQGKFNGVIQGYLASCQRVERGIRTNTIEIITLINELGGDVPVKFFDQSCNTINNSNTRFTIPSFIQPNTPLFVMISLINRQLSIMQHRMKIAVFGGRKSKRLKRKLKPKSTKKK